MNLLNTISNSSIFISDGAMGTNLQSRGLEAGGCPESFNLLHPEIVSNIAKSFFDAGSQMVLSNTFGANRLMLKNKDLEIKLANSYHLLSKMLQSTNQTTDLY